MSSLDTKLCFVILIIFAYIGSSNAQTTVGCTNQTNPCSGNGLCTRYSTCLCNTYYTGDSCEITTAADSRVTIVNGGIPVGGLVAIVVGWIAFGVFSFIAFIFAFWRVGKTNKSWSANKKSRGALPTNSAAIETDKTYVQDAGNNMLTEISHLNNNRSRFIEPEQSRVQNSRIDLGEDENFAINTNASRIEQPLRRETNTNNEDISKIETPYTNDLVRRLQRYQQIPSSLNIANYSKESQAFVNESVRDIPGHLASYLLQEEDNDKTTEIREDQIALNITSPFMKGKTTFRRGDDDDVGEEGDVGPSRSTRKPF